MLGICKYTNQHLSHVGYMQIYHVWLVVSIEPDQGEMVIGCPFKDVLHEIKIIKSSSS
jgi:hypothetical protein